MKRQLHREVWESLGRSDPDWAVLSSDQHRFNGWSAELDTFYASGRSDVAAVLSLLPDEASRGAALDLGCGTGRLSFALAEHFASVTAADISATMLSRLQGRAVDRGVAGVHAVQMDDLVPAADHDLALSLLVLQHLADREAIGAMLALMVGCLRPGGWLVAEIPSSAKTLRARLQPRYRLYRLLRGAGVPASWLNGRGLSGMSMLVVAEGRVHAMLTACGTVVHRVERPEHTDDYAYTRYFARKEG
jgi:2-polyprenyl-3-methyl-5-hydroxy-6-metoxy-1,4-benzoquinol methylase